MIRRRNLLAMASILGSKGKMHGLLLHNNDQFPFFTKISTFTSLNNSNSRVYMGVFGLNLRNCAAQSGDGDGFYKMRAVAPLQQRLLEIGVQQEERERGSVGDGCGGCERGNGNGSSSTGFCSGYSLTEKIVVAVDVDEVLGNFVSALNRFIADRYSSNHSVSEYHVYEFFKIWKCSRDEADIRVHEFFKTPYFKNGIYPIPGAQRTLHKLSRFYNLSIVTSRQNAIKEHTIQWIEKHYPGLFKEIHFGNHFALDGVSRPKSEICRSMGAKVLIDDNPRYAIECANTGMRVLLFDYENSYPWSKADDIHQHPLVTKVHNWDEVERYLLSLVLS